MALPPIPSQAEVAASFYGTWRLFIGDRAGLGYFGSGETAFWRACWVLAAVLPLNLLIYLTQVAGTDLSVSLGLLVQIAIAVIIAWFGYALAAWYVLPALDRGDRYFDYMVPEFWSSLPAIIVQFVAIALEQSDLLPGAMGKALTVASFGAALWLRAQVVRLALDVGYGMAVGLVLGGLVFHAIVAAFVIPG